jgi:hypothetical protein
MEADVMKLERDGRVLVDLLPEGPRDLRENEATANACILGDALARSDAELVDFNGSLLLIRGGKAVQVSQPVLLDLIDQYLGAPHLVDRGGADGPHFVVELQPVTIPRSGDVIRRMLTGKTRAEGGLLFRLPRIQMPADARVAAAG